MSFTPPAPATTRIDTELEATLGAVEARLASLGAALLEGNSIGIDLHASELHRALARAVDHFSHAARPRTDAIAAGPRPPPTRRCGVGRATNRYVAPFARAASIS